MKSKHISKHDFGYGRGENSEIKKLRLRNFKDCKDYVEDIIGHYFLAKVHNNTLEFFSNSQKVEVLINKIK